MIKALVLSLAATPALAAPDIARLIGACEAAVAAGEVAPLEAVTAMRLDGTTWLGEVEGITVVFSPMVPSTCSLLAWSDEGETLVPWTEVAAGVAGWAGEMTPDEGGLFLRATCDAAGVPFLTAVGPDRGGYAGIGELDPPAVRVEVLGVDAEECANAG